MDLNGKEKPDNLLVLGAGESGVGAALLAQSRGYRVFVSDAGKIQDGYKKVLLKAEIDFEEGSHQKAFNFDASEVVKSPGIPEKVQVVQAFRKMGIPLISEIEFASRFTDARKICISGSNGKTTTSTLTHHILQKGGVNARLAGNVGNSFAMDVMNNAPEWYVLELSSFQLEGMVDFRADISVLMNITPDHMDRYDGSFERYAEAKFRILNHQREEDYFIYCADDDVLSAYVKDNDPKPCCLPFSIKQEIPGEGAFLRKNEMIVKINKSEFIMSIETFALQGRHNVYNSMAASLTSRALEIRKEVIRESLKDFQGVEHRLEFVAQVHGIEFINDSKATNVNSAWYALESMTKPVIWIVGGQDKGNDYKDLIPLITSKVKAIICLGSDNKRLIREFAKLVDSIFETTSSQDAVKLAYSIGKAGDVVLLSPACASFDLFKNFEDRGNQFKRAVFDL